MVYLNLLGPTCWKGLDEEVDVGKVAKDWFASSVRLVTMQELHC